MTLLDSLIVGVGTAISKSVLKAWLRDDHLAEATGSLADIAKKKIVDFATRRATERQFEEIADKAAKYLEIQIRQEFGRKLSESQLKMVANAAASTLQNVRISAGIVIEHNRDPAALADYYLAQTGAQGGNPGLASLSPQDSTFSSNERAAYRRSLFHACQLIVDLSSQFPRYDESLDGELLRRLDSMADQVIAGLRQAAGDEADAYEGDYRNACIRRFDQLELFGVDLQETNKRYNLSIAYVTLMVEQKVRGASDKLGTAEEDGDTREALPANEAMAKHMRLFVRGPAGSGKSTLLQWFAVFAAARKLQGNLASLNSCVPFMIRLRDFTDAVLPTPNQFPLEASRAIGERAPQNWAHKKLESGNAIVLVDGLDEIGEDRRIEVRRWLCDLMGAYPNARYVVSSRPHAAEEGWLDTDNFSDAELQEMTRGDIHEFVDHWHAAVAEAIRDDEERSKLPALAKALKERLSKNLPILRLATSPLLCAILCALHRQRVKNLPSDRIELYRLCIEMFFRRDEEREIDARDYLSLTDRQKNALIQDFAWWMVRNEKTTATPDEALNRFERDFQKLRDRPRTGDGAAVLKLFLQRIGIIRQLAPQKIDFPHRTFQEYLAAKAATEEEDLGLLVNNAHNDQWREVVILAAGVLPKNRADSLLHQILKRADSEHFNRHALYLVAVSALDVVVAKPEGSTIEKQIKERLRKIVPPYSIAAANGLAAAGDLVVPFLAYDRNRLASATVACIRTLALIGTDAAHEALNGYGRDSRQVVQNQLATSLGFARDPREYVRYALVDLPGITISRRGFSQLGSLEPLVEYCSELEWLRLQNTSVEDISGLASFRKLQFLDLSLTFVKQIDALGECGDLEFLSLLGTAVSDIGPLSSCIKLEYLNLDYTRIAGIHALSNLTRLLEVSLSGTKVTDLRPLALLPRLRKVSLRVPAMVDLTPLAECRNLEELHVSRILHKAAIADLLPRAQNIRIITR